MAKPLKEQLKAHKTEVLVGGVTVAAAIGLYLRQKKSATTTSATTQSPEEVVTSASLPGTTVATTTGTDAYNGMEDQILGLQQSLYTLLASRSKTSSSSSSSTTSGTTGSSTSSSGNSGKGGTGYYSTPTHATPPSGGGVSASNTLTQEGFTGGGYYIKTSKGGRAMGSEEAGTGDVWSTLSSLTASIQAIDAGKTVGIETALGSWISVDTAAQLEADEKASGNKTTTWVETGKAA